MAYGVAIPNGRLIVLASNAVPPHADGEHGRRGGPSVRPAAAVSGLPTQFRTRRRASLPTRWLPGLRA